VPRLLTNRPRARKPLVYGAGPSHKPDSALRRLVGQPKGCSAFPEGKWTWKVRFAPHWVYAERALRTRISGKSSSRRVGLSGPLLGSVGVKIGVKDRSPQGAEAQLRSFCTSKP
jgi:hypothetical protein